MDLGSQPAVLIEAGRRGSALLHKIVEAGREIVLSTFAGRLSRLYTSEDIACIVEVIRNYHTASTEPVAICRGGALRTR